jgi:hypothetical protein
MSKSLVSRCLTAREVRAAYLALAESGACGGAAPCMRDTCVVCKPLNDLIDARGEQCERRGCTLNVCVYDVQ